MYNNKEIVCITGKGVFEKCISEGKPLISNAHHCTIQIVSDKSTADLLKKCLRLEKRYSEVVKLIRTKGLPRLSTKDFNKFLSKLERSIL